MLPLLLMHTRMIFIEFKKINKLCQQTGSFFHILLSLAVWLGKICRILSFSVRPPPPPPPPTPTPPPPPPPTPPPPPPHHHHYHRQTKFTGQSSSELQSEVNAEVQIKRGL